LIPSIYINLVFLTCFTRCPPDHGARAKIKKTVLDPKLFSFLTQVILICKNAFFYFKNSIFKFILKKDKELIAKNVTYILVILSLFITLVVVVALFTRKKKTYHAPVIESFLFLRHRNFSLNISILT